MKSQFLIGATSSGSGKTTFTIGLLRALQRRGLHVQPYKCGPDYIDPMLHSMATGRRSVNLDTFLASDQHVRCLFQHYGDDADVSMVEGVMGLYDGYNKDMGSSAQLACTLDIPVILLVNAKSVAYSVAPLIYGFKHFHPDLRIAGVVFNMVGSEKHYAMLKEASQDAGIECLGYLPRNTLLNIPERHLGLTIGARDQLEQLISLAADEIEQHVDIDRILQLTAHNSQRTAHDSKFTTHNSQLTIAVAQDEAFNFTYRANIDVLKTMGKVIFFSPLHDKDLPPCDWLYLPGGYPELFAQELSSNIMMRQQIRNFVERDGYVFAECGGFMYLCDDIDGREMCGIFPVHATMENARLHLGYRKLQQGELSVFPGLTATRGHEFHYSDICIKQPSLMDVSNVQLSASNTPVQTQLFHYRNVTAGYTHWYWAQRSLS